MTKRYFYPRWVRDSASDFDYLDKQRARRDLFAYGLRADGAQLTYVAAEATCSNDEMERPEVLAILEELRVLRPGFDDADGRKRARFTSPDNERRFYALRERLAVLLGGVA